jgi:hypothetical protein
MSTTSTLDPIKACLEGKNTYPVHTLLNALFFIDPDTGECCLRVKSKEDPNQIELSNYTILCDTADSAIYYLAWLAQKEDGSGVIEQHYITMPAGTETIGSLPVTAVPCEDAKVIAECFKDENDEIYTQVICLKGATVVATLWIKLSDSTVSTTAPVGAVPCAPKGMTLLQVCDVVTATITGDITYTITGTDVALSPLTGLVTSDDTFRYFWTDFGNGFSDVGPAPSAAYTNDGHYEIKTYAVMASGNKILIATKELDVVSGVVTLVGANPQPVNASYKVSVGSALQEYESTTPVGVPVNADGSAYTVAGIIELDCPDIIDDLEDNAEYQGFMNTSADLIDCVVTVGSNLVTEATDANLIAAGEVATGGGGTITPYHTMLGNPGLNLAGTASGGAMVGGLNVNVGTAITGAQFTYTVNVGSDSDPGNPADLAVVVWDNVAGTSIAATSIVTSLPYVADMQGTGLNYPIYGYPNPVTNPYTIVWTGDLPVGDYTVVFLNQNLGITDNVTVSIVHNIVPGGTLVTTKAQVVALDECTIDKLKPVPVVDPVLLPGGAIIVNTAALSVIAPANTRSFSVKPLIIDSNATALTVTPLYDISFDNGTTWLVNIDGGDTNGEGNRYRTAITNVHIRPSLIVPDQRVYIKWDEA